MAERATYLPLAKVCNSGRAQVFRSDFSPEVTHFDATVVSDLNGDVVSTESERRSPNEWVLGDQDEQGRSWLAPEGVEE